MRGKRKLRKIEAMSTDAEQVYECDLCACLLGVPADLNFSDIQTEFDGHDCKVNSVKNKLAGQEESVCRSIRSNYKIDARSFGEHSEVSISREKRNASIDAGLGDQCIAEARPTPICQHFRP